MTRTLIAVAASVLVLAAVLVMTVSIDSVVMRAIEHYGSEALGTDLSVGEVIIDLAEGKGRISGLRVAQPEGWGAGSALVLGEIVLDLDVGSLASGDPYVLELVRVADPVVFYIRRADGTSNFDALQRNLEGSSEDATRAAQATPSDDDADPRLRIDRFEMEGGRIEADVQVAGVGRQDAKLPALRADRLGGAKGLPAEQLATDLGQRLVTHSVVAVTASGVGRLVKRGGRELGGLLDKLIP